VGGGDVGGGTVAVGGSAVAVDGTSVAVGGTSVAGSGTGVSVGGSADGVMTAGALGTAGAADAGRPIFTSMTHARTNSSSVNMDDDTLRKRWERVKRFIITPHDSY
jgi:hypothetical protein